MGNRVALRERVLRGTDSSWDDLRVNLRKWGFALDWTLSEHGTTL